MTPTERLTAAIEAAFTTVRFANPHGLVAARAIKAAADATRRCLGPLPEGAEARWAAALYQGELVVYVADRESAATLRGLGVNLMGLRFVDGGRAADLPVVAELRQNEGEANGWFLVDPP